MPRAKTRNVHVANVARNLGNFATGDEQPRDDYSLEDEDLTFLPLENSAGEEMLRDALKPRKVEDYKGPPTTLYRFFDAHGKLLYVGVSVNAPYRITQHRQTKDWFEDVASATFSHLPTRVDALEAEAVAIATEDPEMNIVRPSLRQGHWEPKGLTDEQRSSFEVQTRRYFSMEVDDFIEAWRNGEIERDDNRLRKVANFIRLLKPGEMPD